MLQLKVLENLFPIYNYYNLKNNDLFCQKNHKNK